MFAGLDVGLGLFISGLVLIVLAWILLRLSPRNILATPRALPEFVPSEPTRSNDAVLIVQAGGRVEYLNALAREWFNLRKEEPADLERLARRARPAEDFLDLCARPGQRRLSVGGRLVEVTSYQVPGALPLMLISMRNLELSADLTAIGSSVSILQIVTEFGTAVSANLDLQDTLRAVLENVGRLVPVDLLEVKTWDAARQALVPYVLESADGSRVVRLDHSQFANLSDLLVAHHKPLLIADVKNYEGDMPKVDVANPVQSYLGLPLMADTELIGTVEVGHLSPGVLGQQDLDLLQLVAAQAAYAIRNAMVYEVEQRRSTELTGLANLARAFGASQEPTNLFERLIQSIAPLFNVETVGFILYDESKRTLEGQVPFQGLPPHIVEIYRTMIQPGSAAEGIINQRQILLSHNAADDRTWRDLGLQNIAQAASLRESVLVPLVTGDRLIGYFQLSNHRQQVAEFSVSELELADTVAHQAAGIIENTVIVAQTRQRALRSEALRRVASLSASNATLDEILRFSLQELVRLFQADVAAIFLLDEQVGELRVHSDSVVGISPGTLSSLARQRVSDSQYRLTVSGSQKPFISGRLSSDRRVLPVYRPLIAKLEFESAIVVPLVVRERSLGELMLGSHKAEFFNTYDMQVISIAAGQLASAIDSSSLTTQTDESLRRRVEQLTAIARISRELSSMRDLKSLVEIVHNESLRTMHADCGSILLFDTDASSNPLPITLSIGCTPSRAFSALEQKAVESGEPVMMTDFSRDGIQLPHDGARSALVVPVINQDKVAGLIRLHSIQPFFFNEDSIGIARTFAVQVAIALENVQRYQELSQHTELLRRRAETIGKLTEVNYILNFDQPLEKLLRAIANSIREATPFQAVLISVYEPDTGLLRRVTGVGFPADTLAELLSRKQPLASIMQMLKPQFRISRSYFIPVDDTPIIPADVHVVTLDLEKSEESPNAWDPDDFLIVPLEDNHGNPLGLLSADAPRDGLRPDRATIETIEIFAAQATLAISNHALFSQLRTRVDSLSLGLDRQQRLLNVAQNDLPVLLRKDLDQTIAIQNLDQRAQRVRAGLAITESVSRQLDASSALLALGRETLTQLGMSVALVAEATAEGPRLANVMGSVPRATSPEALFGQRNPLRTCLQTGEAILISNMDENLEWRETPLLTALHAKALICLPIKIDNRTVAAMLAASPETLPAFTDEDRQVYYQIARQTSVILQNLSLLNETRRRLQEVNLLLDFSRQLRGLDPERMVFSLLESARRTIHAAHAGVVLLWDEHAELLIPRAVSGYADNETMTRLFYRVGESLPGLAFESRRPLRVDEVQFARDYSFSTEGQLLYRQATGGRLPVSSLLIPILSGELGVGVLVLDNFNTLAAFTPENETLLVSLSQQVGLSLQNVRLVQTAQERAAQLEALTTASTTLTSSLQSDELITSLLDQLEPVIPYDTATLWLRDRQKDRLTIFAARGFPDTERRLGLTIAVEDSALFKEMIRTGQSVQVGDIRHDPRFPMQEAPRLSWMGMPLVSKNEVIGVLALEKWQAHYYTHEHAQVGTTFASQAAVALENERLYEDSISRATELDQRSQRLALLNRFSSALSGLLDGDKILQLTAQELHEALNASRVSVVIFERDLAVWKITLPRTKSQLPQTLPDAPLFRRLKESLGVFLTDAVSAEPDLVPLTSFLGEGTKSLLVLPLASGANLRALLFIHQGEETRFSLNEIELARTLTNQAATALEKARLYQSTLLTAERFVILNQASNEVGASLDPEQIYVAVHRAAGRLMPVESFIISLLDEEADEIEEVYLTDRDKRVPVIRNRRDQGLSGRVVSTGEPLLLHSAEAVNSMGRGSYRPDTPLSILAVPMTLSGKTVGMLSAQSYQPNVYTEDDLQILSTLANQAAVAIQNSRLFNEIQRLAQELEQRVIERTAQLQREQQNTETLLRILTEVSSSLDLDRALNRTLALLNEAIGAEQGTIMLINPEDNLLHYRAGYGYLTDRATGEGRGFNLRIGEGLAGWVVEHRESVLINDLLADQRWMKAPSSAEHRSAIVTPLLVAEDVIGVLMVFHRRTDYFSAELLSLVKAIAGQVAVAINNAHLYELIRDQAERLGSMLRREQEDASRSQAIL